MLTKVGTQTAQEGNDLAIVETPGFAKGHMFDEVGIAAFIIALIQAAGIDYQAYLGASGLARRNQVPQPIAKQTLRNAGIARCLLRSGCDAGRCAGRCARRCARRQAQRNRGGQCRRQHQATTEREHSL